MNQTTLDKAIAAWGPEMPTWVRALAEACDADSMRSTAKRLALSPALVSLTINARRDGVKVDFIRNRVERMLMLTMVSCPVLGAMSRTHCLEEQARPFSSANPLRVQIYRACRNGCPFYKGEKHDS